MFIPFHSFIDVITNSSTEIYVNANTKAVSMVTELIDSILKVAGSDKKAEDLFDISLTLDQDPEDYRLDLGDIKQGDKISVIQAADILGQAYSRESAGSLIGLLVVPKNSDGENLAHLLNVFDVDASYNG